MPRMIPSIILILAAIAPASAQVPSAVDRLGGYADLAELSLASPVIVRAGIARVQKLSSKESPGLATGRVRLRVTAQLSNLLVAPGPLPATLTFLWDAPVDAKGRPPQTKGLDLLAFLGPVDSTGATRLVSRRALQPFDPAVADQVRGLITEARSGKVPEFRGVTNGFRADGTVPGESESQFFLATADGKPATLVVQNRPGEVRRVLLARGDIIDDSAERVKPGTLLWYRLACFLPARLPAAAGGDDPALARDWRDAIASLGPCGKTG